MIARSIGSLLAQDYPGEFRVVLVDDASDDGTARAPRAAARRRAWLTVLAGAPLPAGWTGKLWAVEPGRRAARDRRPPDYLWLTDADIAHAPDNLRRLVARAEAGGLVLTSLMAQPRPRDAGRAAADPGLRLLLRHALPLRLGERPRSARRRRRPAAACWCGATRWSAPAASPPSARAIIDDCALGALMKRQGPIWLGLTDRARSLRPYGSLGDDRPHDLALGLRPARLFAADAGRARSSGMALIYLAAAAARGVRATARRGWLGAGRLAR